ncbi:starch synthase 3, chloroplastic/amyloplastic [Setaria italica]|uniref:starch synthase 3, chloroplastic/amyloplastic n=1 Tax=Setaria italica TaxID=4555 RepID=UPI000BE4F114|nr:starch synthase 3, chloroplastic/amyloplastic [Setaria italica]
MEIALRPQSLLCSRSHQPLVIQPAFEGGGPVQHLLPVLILSFWGPFGFGIKVDMASWGCLMADCSNRKSRRLVYPKIKVNAFRGYAPKVTIQSSTEKSEHHDCNEETIGTYNGQLSTDLAESTNGRDAENAKEDQAHNASSCSAFRETDVIEEVGLDLFKAEFPGNALINISLAEVEALDEAEVEEDKFEVDFSGIALSSAAVWALDSKDEAKAKEDTFVVDLSRVAPYCAAAGEVIDEAEAMQDTFVVYSSGNASSSGTYGDVAEVAEQLGDKQKQLTSGLPEQDLCIVQFSEQNHAIVGSPKQDVGLLEQKQAIVGSYEQDQSIVSSHEQDRSADGSHSQDESIVGAPEQIRSIFGYHKSDQSIVGSYRQDKYTVGLPENFKSIVGYYKSDEYVVVPHKQDEPIVGVPEQTQPVISHRTPDRSIVGFPKHHHSIVHIPEQKQSIVGFHIQDLSIVDSSMESQTKQLAVVRTHDSLLTKKVEAKDGDYTSQKTDGDTLNAKFDVDNLLQKYKEGFTEEAAEMTTSTRIDEERLDMIEEKKGIRVDEWIVTEEGISMSEADFLPLLCEKESSWVEDEVEITEDEEQYEVDEIPMFAEQDIQELPHHDVDQQALQRMLQELTIKNYSLGSKLFVFPEVLKADSTIDLYFNRDLSTLANEHDILIKGAFNGWKWRFFTEKLHMSEQGGDWWCCKLYIPKQAYRLDFVFFNGRTVYENNGNKDFMIQIKSTMDEHLFEDFLVEDKKRELERLAIEEAERRRQAEEQWRREEEREADEADKVQTKVEVEIKKKKLHNVLGLARPSIDNLWYIEPVVTRQRAAVRLYYNRSSRPLVHSTEIWMHGGYNNWIDGLSFSERLVHLDDKDGDWWYADVVLPERTFVLDWVFADGPPGNARNYDNNAWQDFHAILLNNMTEEEYWVEEEQQIYRRLQQERRERKDSIKRKAERTAKMKDEMKKKTTKMFLLSQKHIVYTEPLEIRAGTTVDVLYNPSNTVLTGKLEVWFRCSFNRWMHPGGVLTPQKMVKVENGSHLKATVNVPRDAYMMDFVFSEFEEGGIYDNRNGLDYHIPVFGSTAKEPPIHIVHIAVEMAPIAKVGGLADVVTSLSRAVQDLGHNVEVILPKHDCLNLSNVKNLHMHQSFSFGGSEIKVWCGLVEDLCVYFLEPQNGLFGVGCVYGRNDDLRFGFFCHSALEFLLQSGSSPHILHCHDWSSAPVAWLYKEHYAQSSLTNARVVFTIHNLEFGAHYIGKAMRYCDKATTVSNTYSREVSGHGAIAPHLGKFHGILNGIDPDIWDPYNDNFIPVHYTSENVVEGKSAAKKALQQKLGLQQNDVPIVGIVTRLTAQKGIHLIKHAIQRTLEWNGQVVLLGSAPDPRIQGDFVNFANTLHGVNYGRVRLCLTYDEPLSHLIYAGSDFILVPSIFEPCGLTQLVAMRYGAIPIVRKTGGLYDTVFDVDSDKERAWARGLEPNGFSFDGADSRGVDYALNRAISAWFDARSWFHSLCKRVMEQDWSWNRPALDYIELYHSASKL